VVYVAIELCAAVAIDSERIAVAVVAVGCVTIAVDFLINLVRMQKFYRCLLLVRQGSKLMVGGFALIVSRRRSRSSSR